MVDLAARLHALRGVHRLGARVTLLPSWRLWGRGEANNFMFDDKAIEKRYGEI